MGVSWPSYVDEISRDGYTEYQIPGGRGMVQGDFSGSLTNAYITCGSGSQPHMTITGSGWTLRNVGMEGYARDNTHPGTTFLTIRQGSGTIENCAVVNLLGSGTPGTHRETGCWVDPDFTGTLDVTNYYTEGFSDNGFYASAPKGGAEVHFKNSMAVDCGISGFRYGQSGGSYARNCHTVNCQRGIWIWDGPALIEDCELDASVGIATGNNSNVAHARVRNTSYSSYQDHNGSSTFEDLGGNDQSPNPQTPSGTPTSAQEAASGGGGTEPQGPACIRQLLE